MNAINLSLIDLIGKTPVIKIEGFDTGPCELFLKLENQNPGGSIKDRIGLSIIREAERSGELVPGGTIVEATAGNTGIGLALVAALKGYQLILVIPDKMSREKILHLEGLGAKVIVTRSDVSKGHPEYYQDLAESIAKKTPNSFLANQFSNPANALAHRTTTGPEIWDQMDGKVDAIVVGVGSGGTATGLAEFFKQKNSNTEIVIADPEGSVVADAVISGQYKYQGDSWMVEGVGEDFIPTNVDLSLLDDAVTVKDSEAFSTVQKLLRNEGILAGSSSGTLISGAIKWCQKQTSSKKVLTFVCDTGNKYLSKAFNKAWLKDNGLLSSSGHGNLLDLISKRADKGEMVSVTTNNTLLTAYNRMRGSDVSQLPVIEDGRLVGFLDEEDLLMNVYQNEKLFSEMVSTVMVSKLETLDVQSDEAKLLDTLSKGKVAIMFDKDLFVGFITKVDLINRYKSAFALS